MSQTFPLVTRAHDAPIAFLTKPLESAGLAAGEISTRVFLKHVTLVAEKLDQGKFAINLCENRYLFLVGFCAAILRGQTTLLPPNKNIATQQQLLEDYDKAYVLHDGCEVITTTHNIDITAFDVQAAPPFNKQTPLIQNDHLACISFTSGSTGRAKPNLKYWHTLHRSTAINYRFMVADTNHTVYQLATMPAQHMWGLETSALMPLFEKVCMSDAKPLFPQDIVDTLKALPEPTMLVSTPVHLRALSGSDTKNISLYTVLCATSPLTTEMAELIETQFSAPLYEVYGCSEVGSMAVRRTAQTQIWRRFDGIHFKKDGTNTLAWADHLPVITQLQDIIEPVDQQHFTLAGRASDLIKIAGKRGSLLHINQILLGFTGLDDGIIIHPASDSDVTRLCAIVALKSGTEKPDLVRYLKARLDSAFVPRPIYIVDALPRESNGKILRWKVDALLETLRSKRSL